MSTRTGILASAAMFMFVAYAGHLLLPAADLVWLVIGFFGLAAVPSAFTRSDTQKGSRR